MGMSIDEAIKILERGSQFNYYDSAEDFCKAYDIAIDTMRKYQKIEQIVTEYVNDDLVGMSDYWMGRIKEVMGDGDDD